MTHKQLEQEFLKLKNDIYTTIPQILESLGKIQETLKQQNDIIGDLPTDDSDSWWKNSDDETDNS